MKLILIAMFGVSILSGCASGPPPSRPYLYRMSVDCKNAAVQTRYLESQIQNSNDDDISQIKTLIWNIREQCTREEAPTYISNSGQKIYVRNGDGSVHYMNKENTTIVQQQLKPGEKRHHKSLKEVQE